MPLIERDREGLVNQSLNFLRYGKVYKRKEKRNCAQPLIERLSKIEIESEHMSSNEQLSASALQILEKKARMKKMLDLAIRLTKEKIQKILKAKPQATKDEVVKLVEKQPIPIKPFLYEYITDTFLGESVTVKTAQAYFDSYAKRLKRTFIEVRRTSQGKKIDFHLNEGFIIDTFFKVNDEAKKKT